MSNFFIYAVKVVMKNEEKKMLDNSIILVKAFCFKDVSSYVRSRIDIKETIEISKDFGVIFCDDIKDIKDLTSKLEVAYKRGYADGQQSLRKEQ